MALSTPKICVVIPTFNNKELVLECLKTLVISDTKGFVFKICVVDNGSSDGTSEAIKKGFPKVKLIEESKNLGFVEGCNAGMQWGLSNGFNYITLLNDDTTVDKKLIKNIVIEHKRYKHAGAISAKIYFTKGYEYRKNYKESELGKVIWYAGGNIDWANVYGSNRGVDEVDHGQYEETGETEFATGCFVMFKAETLRKVGLYDQRYFAYLEDADHSQRLKRAGWKVLYSPKGHLWHKVAQVSAIGSGTNDYFLTRNRMVFGLKYASFRARFALIRESFRLLMNGRKWQKIGVRDYYLGRFRKGSWHED